MFKHQLDVSAYQRILKNDTSDPFSIIITFKSVTNQDENIIIEKQNQILIKTTVNKARVISKTIDEMYTIDPSLKQFEFEIKNSENTKTNDIIEIFQLILKSINEEITISGDQHEMFLSIINLLGEEETNSIVNANVNQNENQQQEEQQRNEMNIFKCDFEGDELSGIISCIRQMTGEILNGNDIIRMSSGGTQDPNHPLTNIVKYDADHIDNYFYNFLMPIKSNDGWIEFDFLNRKVQITSYTIRTNMYYQFYYHPKTWKIIGSNDHLKWDLIDIQNDREEMNGVSKQNRYTCNRNNCNFYQYIRFVQIENWGDKSNKGFIYLSCIEFFGSISSSE